MKETANKALSLKTLTKGNVWDIQENDIFRLWEGAEKDADVKYHLNFALLVSTYSFSCGNLLPALLKDYGIPLIGKLSGGGSCCVLYNPSADGFGYRYSTHRVRLINTNGENIDRGIVPTYELETDDFFNITKVTQLIESYYAK